MSSSHRPLSDNTQHSQQTDVHVQDGIRTHNLSRRVAAYPRLGQRGDRPNVHNTNSNSRNSKRQCSLFSKKNPFIRIFCVSGWIAIPSNILDRWSSNICEVIKPRLSGISICESFWVFSVYGSVHRWFISINVQWDATQTSLFIILQVQSTCFGCQPHPSSGVHKTLNYSLRYWSYFFVRLPPFNMTKLGHVGGR